MGVRTAENYSNSLINEDGSKDMTAYNDEYVRSVMEEVLFEHMGWDLRDNENKYGIDKVFHPHGSKERLFEMMQKVNKVRLNEDFGGNPEAENSTDMSILEKSFNELKSGMLRIKQTNTQTEGGETFLELICFSQQGSDTVFRFKIKASEGDQDGVLSVNDAELISLTLAIKK